MRASTRSYADAPIDRLAEGAAMLRARSQPPRPASPSRRDLAFDRTRGPDVAGAAPPPRPPRPRCNDLESLAAAIAAFDGCPLKTQGAKQAVFSRGTGDAPLMIIGEGPGADEDAQGQPFVGRAGKLLDRMLKAAGSEGPRLHHQHRLLAPARQPHADAAGAGDLRAVRRTRHRPGAAEDAAAGRRRLGQAPC
jgi:hypothetical protein